MNASLNAAVKKSNSLIMKPMQGYFALKVRPGAPPPSIFL